MVSMRVRVVREKRVKAESSKKEKWRKCIKNNHVKQNT